MKAVHRLFLCVVIIFLCAALFGCGGDAGFGDAGFGEEIFVGGILPTEIEGSGEIREETEQTEEENVFFEEVLGQTEEENEYFEGETGETEEEPVRFEEPTEEPQEGEEKGETADAPTILPQEREKAVYVRATADSLNVRSGAGRNFASLGFLDKGDMVAYLGEENGWYKTYYRNRTAYVSKAYSELYYLEKGDETVEKVIEEGLKLLGTPYVYGAVRYHDGNGRRLSGFSVEKFDCSSLMQYIFFVGAGKNLDLTTRTQIFQGSRVEEMRRGDLLFFTNASRKDKTGVERVGHVALYLGDNYILHTASDHAVIEKISPTRRGYFLQANRI